MSFLKSIIQRRGWRTNVEHHVRGEPLKSRQRRLSRVREVTAMGPSSLPNGDCHQPRVFLVSELELHIPWILARLLLRGPHPRAQLLRAAKLSDSKRGRH